MGAGDWHGARVLSARFDGAEDPRAWLWINRSEQPVTCMVNDPQWRVALDSSDLLEAGAAVNTSFVLAPLSVVVLTRPA